MRIFDFILLVVIVVFVIVFSVFGIESHANPEKFNATAWNAMFVKLRVINCADTSKR